MSLDEVAFITLTNGGYIKFTLNCLESLKKINFNKKLQCYSIGKYAHEVLSNRNYNSILIDDESNTNFQSFRQGNWSNITYRKFEIIYENLLKKEYKYVCITDGDIVFENPNFLNYCIDNIKDYDILFQNGNCDLEIKSNFNGELCSGFMFIKSNDKMISVFNPNNVTSHINENGWDDQKYLNEIKSSIKFDVLPINLFPNGHYFYNKIGWKNVNPYPYLIHFNFCIGHDKKRKMKLYRKWYIRK
jgi:hypothetical protein